MKNKYSLLFHSRKSGQEFTLTYELQGGRYMHLVRNVQVYQHTGDLFATVAMIGDPGSPWRFHVETMFSDHFFAIEIHVNHDGCDVFINETLICTIASKQNLQPCN